MGVLIHRMEYVFESETIIGTVVPLASTHGSRIQWVGMGMTSPTNTPNKPPPEIFAFYTEKFEPADLEILVLK